MTGLEILKNPSTTAGEIADIISASCPPIGLAHCDNFSCRECWLAWLTTGEAPQEKEPSDEQTAPDDEGLHVNLIEHFRRQRRIERELESRLTHLHE